MSWWRKLWPELPRLPPREMTDAEKVAHSIAEAFRSGTVEGYSVKPHEIGWISVRWNNKTVVSEFYSDGRPSSLRFGSYDGKLPLSNHLAQQIGAAAYARARTLGDDVLTNMAKDI